MFSDMAMLLILILGSVSALVDDNSTSVAYQDDNKLVAAGVLGEERRRHGGDHHFDLLIFTQHWPYTTCLDWEEKRHGSCSKIGDLCLKTKNTIKP